MYLDLFKFKMSFYGLYHGKSPFFTTIWENMFGFFSRHPTSKSKCYNNPLRAHLVDTDGSRKKLEEMSHVVDQNWSVKLDPVDLGVKLVCSLKETC